MSGPLFTRYWKLDVVGSLPERPFVVAANHFSHLDPVIIGRVVGPMRYLAVDELYGMSPGFDWLITWLGAIPLTRTAIPLRAMRDALGTLASGMPVGLFPEGRRVWTWAETTPKRGAAWLAARAGVPLVPLAVWGTQESMGRGSRRIRRWPVHVAIGDPVHASDHPPGRQGQLEMMAEWHRRVDAGLRDLRERSALEGSADQA